MSWIWDLPTPTLPTKTDRKPLLPGANPNQYVRAADLNNIREFLYDLRQEIMRNPWAVLGVWVGSEAPADPVTYDAWSLNHEGYWAWIDTGGFSSSTFLDVLGAVLQLTATAPTIAVTANIPLYPFPAVMALSTGVPSVLKAVQVVDAPIFGWWFFTPEISPELRAAVPVARQFWGELLDPGTWPDPMHMDYFNFYHRSNPASGRQVALFDYEAGPPYVDYRRPIWRANASQSPAYGDLQVSFRFAGLHKLVFAEVEPGTDNILYTIATYTDMSIGVLNCPSANAALTGPTVVAAQPGIQTISVPAANTALVGGVPTKQTVGNILISPPGANVRLAGFGPDVVWDFYATPYRDAWLDIPLDSVITGRGRIRGATVTITWSGDPGSPWTGQVQNDQTWSIPVRLVTCVYGLPGGPALFVFQETGVPAQQNYFATGSGDRPLVPPAATMSVGGATPTVAVI